MICASAFRGSISCCAVLWNQGVNYLSRPWAINGEHFNWSIPGGLQIWKTVQAPESGQKAASRCKQNAWLICNICRRGSQGGQCITWLIRIPLSHYFIISYQLHLHWRLLAYDLITTPLLMIPQSCIIWLPKNHFQCQLLPAFYRIQDIHRSSPKIA